MTYKLRGWHWWFAAVLMLALAQPVWAHAMLIRSTPGLNASLVKAPAEIRLWFTEPLESRFGERMLLLPRHERFNG